MTSDIRRGAQETGARSPRRVPRMTKRPPHLDPPLMPESPPVPEPRAAERAPDPDGRDPTRYGDWEKKGVAVDF